MKYGNAIVISGAVTASFVDLDQEERPPLRPEDFGIKPAAWLKTRPSGAMRLGRIVIAL